MATMILASACGGRGEIEGPGWAIPGITAPATTEPETIQTDDATQAVITMGCDGCYTQCAGTFAVATEGFEFCNNDCVTNCSNGTGS